MRRLVVKLNAFADMARIASTATGHSRSKGMHMCWLMLLLTSCLVCCRCVRWSITADTPTWVNEIQNRSARCRSCNLLW
jgi:hypothetical protein